MERRTSTRCAALLCTNNSRNSNHSFFKFPIDNNRSNLWALACSRDDLLDKPNLHNLSYRLCGMHFEKRMFLNASQNRLQKNAFPSIFPAMESTSSDFAEQASPDETVPTTESKDTIEIIENIFLSPIKQEESSDTEETFIKSEVLSPADTQTEAVLPSSTPQHLKRKLTFLENENAEENANLLSKVIKIEPVDLATDSTSDSATLLEDVTLEDFKKLTYKFCPSKYLANFINIQASLRQKLPEGSRYSDDFKKYWLMLYFSDPELYRNSLSKMFGFPSVRILQKFIQEVKLRPGINPIVFETFKRKVQYFKKFDKFCILCVDEISTKANLFLNIDRDEIIGFVSVDVEREFKPAITATVIMARGLHTKWKQPLAYYLVNSKCPGEKLKDVILNTITQLNDIDMTVVGVVTDMGSNNIKLAKLLDVTTDTPFFMHNNMKIVYLFDVPHLLKSLRNTFMKHTLVMDNTMILWDFLKQFYEHDKEFAMRVAPKLTDSHISPGNIEKRKVRYASQIFSNKVAAGMSLYVRFGKLPREAQVTGEFIGRVNHLFDILNSSSNDDPLVYQQAYSGKDEQKQFLLECYRMFENLQVFNRNGDDITIQIKCLWGWKTTIHGVIHLWDILKTFKFKSLLTRRINLDCLEHFFGSIRQQGENIRHPTPIQFTRAFKKCFCLNMLYSGTETYESDHFDILFKIEDVQMFQTEETPMNVSPKLGPTDYQTSDNLQQNFAQNICGYLIKTCLSMHSCELCESYATEYVDLDDTSIGSLVRAYNHSEEETGHFYMPNKTFVDYITCLEILFQKHFESFIVKNKVVLQFVNIFKTVQFTHPCNNFPYDYLVKLYARLRIYYTLKAINKNFKTSHRNEKLIIWRNT